MVLRLRKRVMDKLPKVVGKHTSSNPQQPLRVAINGIHSKSGGGLTYLRNILPILANMPDIELHLFLHRNQFSLFSPISDKINVTLFSFRPTFFRTLMWEQLAIPKTARKIECDVLFFPTAFTSALVQCRSPRSG